jgi:2-keto-4-pentenoate hydratase
MVELDPRVREGLAAQLDDWRGKVAGGARRVGWKMGRGIEEVEAVMGTRPVIGHLVGTTMVEPGGVVRWPGGMVRAETELGLVVGNGERIAGICVALEIVDVGPPRGDVVELLAANVLHRAFALGPAHAPAATGGRRTTLAVDGEVRGQGRLLDDYGETVRDAARLLDELGEALEPGDLVIAGSAVHVPVEPGDRVTCAIEGLGEVGVRLE